MNTSSRIANGLIATAVSFVAPASAVDEWRFDGVDRVVAVADIHGAHSAFVDVLRQSGVIDDSDAWVGGDTHLVIVGDVVDRGADSRAAMDLIRRLEDEAPAAGGAVHLVLGNHELMNLTGDLRYVAAGEYAAFAADESTERRDAAFERLQSRRAANGEPLPDRPSFDEQFPPGYFAHRDAFSAQGEYGAWLLEQPLLLVVNETVFVHGGLSAATAELGADGVNTEVGQQIRDYVATLGLLVAAGVIHESDNFYDHPDAIAGYAANVAAGAAAWPDDAEAQSNALAELNRAFVFDGDGPLWYRGTVGCSAPIERGRLETALSSADATRVVVGHTPTASARIEARLGGSVLRVDTGMLSDYYGGRAAALILEGDRVGAVYQGSSETVPPDEAPRRVGRLPDGVSPAELEMLLRSAEIVGRSESADGDAFLVELSAGGVTLTAEFVAARRDDFVPEVAAYRLDRMLGLDMVPVTVVREIDGDVGSLQYRPDGIVTETERSAGGLGAGAWCPLSDQFQAMYVFDALILNEGRTQDSMRYDRANYQLVLVGHQAALSTGRGLPAYLRSVELQIGSAWRAALEGLDEDNVAAALDDVLDSRRQRALLRRRDEILDTD
ncbi:MAG TPA: metallophosphoesterase [Gammaproteobacteria bacterium]